MNDFLKVMIPDDSPSCSPLTPVHTLAFIDLETTGLPYDVGTKNVHITELAIVAIDRQHFERDFNLRVMHKINLFIKPRAAISYGASSVTGLYNDMLEFQKPFDESISKILEMFFSRLRSPICLIAHNGNRFDFPLLQAELKRLSLLLPEDITCADSLQAFRTFGLIPPNISINNAEPSCSKLLPNVNTNNGKSDCADAVKSNSDDDLLSEDIEIFKDIDLSLYCNLPTIEKCNNITFSEVDNKNSPIIVNNNKMGIKSFFPVKKLKISNISNTNINRKKKSTMEDTSKPKIVKGKGFSLEKLYIHYFGEKPEHGHHAESDCIHLCQVCQKVSSTFLPWLDHNQVLFSQVNSMW